MLVQRVISPVSSRESWTVLGVDDAPVEPIERYLVVCLQNNGLVVR
jgi:hypothetical protein